MRRNTIIAYTIQFAHSHTLTLTYTVHTKLTRHAEKHVNVNNLHKLNRINICKI